MRTTAALAPLLFAVLAHAAPPQVRIETDRLRGHIEALPADRSVSGDDEDAAGLREAAGYIEGRLRAFGYKIQDQEVVWGRRPGPGEDPDTTTSRNLWADLPGTTRPGEVIVLASHYDAVPGSPGADDNATGVAANLELARVLRGHPMERTVRFLFPTAEEVGMVGSRRYVAEHVVPAIDSGEETIFGMVSLEMLGYFSDEPGSQQVPAGALPGFIEIPTRGDFIAIVGILPHAHFHVPLGLAMMESAPGLEVLSTGLIPSPIGDMVRSDHSVFWAIGVPAVMLTDTSNFRNPHYHQATDTIETLDFDRFTLVVRGVAGAVHRLAGPVAEGDRPDENIDAP
jgi:hypothetical protein